MGIPSSSVSQSHEPFVPHVFILALTGLGALAMIIGAVLAIAGYSSAGAFSIGAACVGVLGTLAAENRKRP